MSGSEFSSRESLRSVHTPSFLEILEQLGISVMVTTYQAGRLVILRAQEGALNTHFRCFDRPMGLALAGSRLAIGAATSIWEFHNLPAVCESLNRPSDGSAAEVPAKHDACFLPRSLHWTGDVRIHEMAWIGDGNTADLWFVNTRFSCLCRRNNAFSFEPVWRPPFVTSFKPGDSCHLNGLALRDGRARYVTALGTSDEPGGWREHKQDGGVLIDVDSSEIIVDRLSMPHSPRWYNGRLWLLESGTGGFGYVDLDTGSFHTITKLPGFTRGLSFAGPFALIGLSQVRETAFFGGVPITEQAVKERACGVWVVNIETGATMGFVKFEDAVQEIFAVEALSFRYPELVNDDRSRLADTFELPDETLADVPVELRANRR